jgi:hypothetical protein
VINFRYHVVSITSVFLALAIGLVLGTAALNGPVANDLNSRVTDLRQTNSQLRDQVANLDKQVQGRDGFVRQVAPTLLAGKLRGKTALVVTLPGALDEHRDGVLAMLRSAGASATGTIRFTEAFVDPTRSFDEVDLATRLAPVGITGLPAENNGVETAGALFGRAFSKSSPTVTDASRTAILAGFRQLKLIEADGPIGAADSVVVVAGAPLSGSDAERRNAGVLTLVTQLAAGFDKDVLAAPTAAGDGNVVAAVRGDDALAAKVSTVDTVASAEGQLAAAMALAGAFTGSTGHYGSGDGADTPVPILAQ